MKNGPYELVPAPDNYPGRRYRDRYCYEHHLVWWQNTGELPGPDEVVHHQNGDGRDNRFENLELKTRSKHSEGHGKERSVRMVRLKCPSCGVDFSRQRRKTHLVKKEKGKATFCSRSCTSKLFGRSRGRRHLTEAQKKEIDSNVVEEYTDPR